MTNWREFFMKKLNILFKPEDVEMGAKEFLSTYASYCTEIGLVGKRPNGYTIYPSRTAPVEDTFTGFFEEWINLTDALDIKTVVSMDFYTDGWFAKDPKYQTMTPKGKTMAHQICPNREEYWQYGAEIVKELGSYPIDEILVFGSGFIREKFCFCERCRNEFAPLVGQEPDRLTFEYIIENDDYRKKWHEWRQDKVISGLGYLKEAAQDVDAQMGREEPLRITAEVLLDAETGFSEGAKAEYGYDYQRINQTTGSIAINLYPWSPLLPSKGSKEYNELIESLYFTNEFKRRGGSVSLFRWGISTIDQFDELAALGKEAGVTRFISTFSYPTDYSIRREAAIGNY
ncbi:MAG: hypothetical protein GF411_11765 [Candidatus Lokiarchaeota archaeon]|nr:hypothetical protein [Candidatus Lokiarchaeota archaeon]